MFPQYVIPAAYTRICKRFGRIAVSCFVVCVSLGAENPTAPAHSLTAHLAALKDTRTLNAQFICEKRLALLETPLLSSGQLWIKKGDPKDGAVRFSTQKPYTSELILIDGKVHVRSQHETDWSRTNQSSRPGLTAVMSQLGGWSTGDPGKLTEHYAIATSADPVPDLPAGAAKENNKPGADVYALTPTNKDLLKAVKKITLAIDQKSHHLLFIEILTQQDDVTRYWFFNVRTNADLPNDIFSPNTAPPAPASAPAGNKP
jgi:outer membrane lipoprotein-sorting protein